MNLGRRTSVAGRSVIQAADELSNSLGIAFERKPLFVANGNLFVQRLIGTECGQQLSLCRLLRDV